MIYPKPFAEVVPPTVNMSDDIKIEIRLLTENDLGGAMRLKEMAGWNQTEDDWRRLLRLNADGCFAAAVGGRLVATTTTTQYGHALAWVGMVLVDPEFRRRGIATALVRAALDSLKVAGVATVKLDATPAGARVYEALGFEAELRVERWSGTARASVEETADSAVPSHLFEFDTRAFGADRSELLKALLDESLVAPSVRAGADGRLRGYALARRGAQAAYVGPVVAEEADTAAGLLDDMLNLLGDGQVYVDLNTTFVGGACELAARGFVKQRELVRMRLGRKSRAGTSDRVFSIAGPEVG